ncbi:hypothetical protein [Streptosporangium sp. OZ121]|uniref:hypothetical protein n=1 Tax=Streptosporangium sp. OZ121 TaxID=3444183 RepID=UPI003F7B2785
MLAQNWQDSGVVADTPADTALTVTTLGTPGEIYVQPGQATVRGFHYVNESPLSLTVPTNVDPSYARIDLVVVRLDKATNAVRAYLKTGIPASTPVPPTVDRSFDSTEIPLARVTVAAGSNTVPTGAGAIADVREFVGKRVRMTDEPGTLPLGSIAYRPSEDTFYGVGSGGATALGSGGGGTPGPGGVTICTSTTRPPSPTAGQLIYETNTYRQLVWTGAAWQAISYAPALVRRRYSGDQSVDLAASATFYEVNFITADYDIVPAGSGTWTSSFNTTYTRMPPGTIAAESFWQATFTCKLPAPVSGGTYQVQVYGGTANTFTQSVTASGTNALYAEVTGIMRIPFNTAQGTYARIARIGGTAGGVTISDAALSLHRIG